MDEADFSEDVTYKQQEDLPYDGDLSLVKTCTSYNFTLTNATFPVSQEAVPEGGDPQEVAAHCEVLQNTALPETWDKMTDLVVSNRLDKDKQCSLASPVPANKEDTSESHISDILLHLSREQFFRGQDAGYETPPETSNAESLDDADTLTNIISCYAKNYYPKEQSPAFAGQPSPQNANSSEPCCFPGTGENTSPLEKPLTARESDHQEEPSFLTRTKGLGDKCRSCLRQTPQRQLADKASLGNWFRYSPAQVHYQFPDLSKAAPKVKISRNPATNKPLTVADPGSYSPRLRNKSTVVQDNLGTMSGSNRVEKQPEQKWKLAEPSKLVQVQPATLTCQEPLTGLEPETWRLNLTPIPQKDPFSNSYIFQKISQGKQMCQKLKEQTDQLKSKVQEFSERIKQDPFCRVQDIRLFFRISCTCMLKNQPPDFYALVFSFTPHVLYQVIKEQAGCLPGPWGSQESEVTKELNELASKMKQKMEERSHRRTNSGNFSSSIHEQTPHQDSPLGSDPATTFSPDSGTGLQSNKCEACGSQTQRVCEEDPPEARSKTKWIWSWRVNSEPFQDEHDSAAGKHSKTNLTSTSDLATPSPHLCSLGIPRTQSLCASRSREEIESKILDSPLDRALRTATKLKKTTDQMIKSIAEDLTKAQRWRHQLRY